ncbi:hypothetical protein [Lysinibacillus sp. BW-2-10]|uniref:hypothetical protein n=1 Tax=Lysinibacillus sp. BW-2-10 TaxID=2590030 RepID=UPI00117DB259|nr:hypothetical protein [Lysinibacillus sp. BW-2-10]TSI07322.1 hypothetical protein FJQ64_08450 [Lysinibacillus sp. BW-2-10]
MDTNLYELKDSFKQLTKNLSDRIDSVCENIKNRESENLQYWFEDFSVFTEVAIILISHNIIDLEVDSFNEKVEILLDKVEDKDYLFVADILKFELKPLLIYLDGCMTND